MVRSDRSIVKLAILFVALARVADAAAEDLSTIPGIGPAGPPVELHKGLVFTEGPATDAEGNVYFTDVPRSLIYKCNPDGDPILVRRDSGRANGLMFNAQGQIVAAIMEGRLETIDPVSGKTLQVLASDFNGQKFNGPNDLVVDSQGGVYFSDPQFLRSASKAPAPGVYYIAADGKLSALIDDLAAPNGVILSPDEKTLYVMPYMQAEMMAYPVESPGKLGPGRVFCVLEQPPRQTKAGGDGTAVDVDGNVYIAMALGIQVFNSEGKSLGIIKVPKPPSNVEFGGADLKTLYVTARSSVYTLPMLVKGHRFQGGKAAAAK